MIRLLGESFISSAFWLLVMLGIVCAMSGCHVDGAPFALQAFIDWAAGNLLLIAFLGLYAVAKFHLEPKSIGPAARSTKRRR